MRFVPVTQIRQDAMSVETTVRTLINPEHINAMYPRVGAASADGTIPPGTRISFLGGGGFAVAESVEDLEALLQTH